MFLGHLSNASSKKNTSTDSDDTIVHGFPAIENANGIGVDSNVATLLEI